MISNCDIINNPSLPPSPYIYGYFRFDGKGDFLRSSDLNPLEVTFNASGFSSGVYFYSLQSGNNKNTKKKGAHKIIFLKPAGCLGKLG